MKGKHRLVIIGLDGMSVSQLRFVCKKFSLKNLSEFIKKDSLISISSELPELSPVNWTSFYTGKGPEEHGIFGFVDLDPRSYKISISDFTKVKCTTIFDKLGQKNIISKVINLPNTYPAPPIRGVLISGFVARDLANSVYPKVYLPILEEIDYKLEPDTIKGIRDPDHLLKEVFLCLESKKKVIDLLWPDLIWDVFVLIFTETDRINHFLYPAIFDEKNPLHSICKEFFKKLDQIIGDILDRFSSLPSPKRLMVVSDHGFTELITEIDINVILKSAGMFFLEHKPKSELDASFISERTVAFALDPGRIYVHKKGIYSRGRVSKEDYKKVINDLISLLKEVEFKGQKVFEKIYLCDELYPGSKFINTPDIVAISKRGFDLKAKFDRDSVFGHYGRFGTHYREDVLYYDSKLSGNIKRVRDIGIEILRHFQNFIYT